MTTYDHTARPAWAVTAWCDDRFIYIELPVKDGPPYIQKFSLTEGGLSKALHMMRDARAKHPVAPHYSFLALDSHPKIVKKKSIVSQEQRDRATAVLRRLKMLPGGR